MSSQHKVSLSDDEDDDDLLGPSKAASPARKAPSPARESEPPKQVPVTAASTTSSSKDGSKRSDGSKTSSGSAIPENSAANDKAPALPAESKEPPASVATKSPQKDTEALGSAKTAEVAAKAAEVAATISAKSADAKPSAGGSDKQLAVSSTPADEGVERQKKEQERKSSGKDEKTTTAHDNRQKEIVEVASSHSKRSHGEDLGTSSQRRRSRDADRARHSGHEMHERKRSYGDALYSRQQLSRDEASRHVSRSGEHARNEEASRGHKREDHHGRREEQHRNEHSRRDDGRGQRKDVDQSRREESSRHGHRREDEHGRRPEHSRQSRKEEEPVRVVSLEDNHARRDNAPRHHGVHSRKDDEHSRKSDANRHKHEVIRVESEGAHKNDQAQKQHKEATRRHSNKDVEDVPHSRRETIAHDRPQNDAYTATRKHHSHKDDPDSKRKRGESTQAAVPQDRTQVQRSRQKGDADVLVVEERTSESKKPPSVNARGSESSTQTAVRSSKRSTEPAAQASRPKPQDKEYERYKKMVTELFVEFAPQKMKDIDALMEKYSENLEGMYDRIWQKYKGNTLPGNSDNEPAAKRRKPEKPAANPEVASSPPAKKSDKGDTLYLSAMERFQKLTSRSGTQESSKRKTR